MPRADLIALSHDDLTALTNRGTVKRAVRELDNAEVTGDLKEAEDGTIAAQWSDGLSCLIPGGAVVANSRCSCPATELCRHVIRTVLAYQRQAANAGPADTPSAWNPGDISDDEIANHFKPAVLKLAREQFQNGLLIELLRGHKPACYFHDLACTLRFQVAGDIRYVHCDCADQPPCIHVPLAVWAFRKLPADKNAAILSTQEKPLPAPIACLDQINETLVAGLEFGLSGAGNAWRDQLSRVESVCRPAGLIWPAEVVAELIQQIERYTQHDALFNPDRFAELVGELLIRADAIRNDTGTAPQLLIRGAASDRWTDLAAARFIGLGCGVRQNRRSATLITSLQDANSGSLVAVRREFADPSADAKEEPRAFWQLAQTPIIKGASFAQIGAGQLLTQGGKRATNHELVLGRAKATVNPQNFSWESLRSPVLAESFAEIRERLAILPPASLRPRRVAENFHVCPVAGVENAGFVPSTQMVQATVKDSRGDLALLRLPFTHRGSEGAERLLAYLTNKPAMVRFVAGTMRIAADGLCLEPVAVVVEEQSRTLLQPWIDRRLGSPPDKTISDSENQELDPVEAFVRDVLKYIGEIMVMGLRRADARILRNWQELMERASALGLLRLAATVKIVISGLLQRSASVQWSWRSCAAAVLELAVFAQLAQEIGI